VKRLLASLCLLLLWPGLSGADTPKTKEALLQQALEAYHSKQYDDSILAYQEVLKQDPASADAYQGLGNCFLAKGDQEKALGYYRYSLQANPLNQPLAAYVKKLSESQASAGDDANKFYQYGTYYLGSQKWDYALYYLKKSAALNPKDPRCLEALGKAFQGKGDEAHAQESFQKALALDPDNQELKKLVQAPADHIPRTALVGGVLAVASVLAIFLF
jgi:tetratricopeptide (TPR) repeat protein